MIPALSFDRLCTSLQEKRNIYDQISAADELKKQQQDLTQRLREQLTYFSVEEIERKIKVCSRCCILWLD